MYMLVLQTFLLMVAAFVVGAALACMLKRTVHRFAGTDLPPEETLHVEVPPAVHRLPSRCRHPNLAASNVPCAATSRSPRLSLRPCTAAPLLRCRRCPVRRWRKRPRRTWHPSRAAIILRSP